MAKTVQPIAIELGIKGGEKLGALNRSFRDLSKQIKLSDADIIQATKDVAKFAQEAGDSEATIRAQIKAFEGLRAQANVTSTVYRDLGKGIVDLKASLDGLGAKSQARAKNLAEIGTSAKSSVSQIKKAIEELKLLSKEARTGSDAFARLKSNIADMGEALELAEGKAKKQKEISNLLNGTLRKSSTLIGLQAKAYRERVAITEKQIQAIDLLSKKERSTVANTEKRVRLEEQLQNQLLKVAQTGYLEFIASSRSETIKLAEAFNTTDASINSFRTRLKALDADFGKLPNTTAGLNQKLAELKIELNNTVRSSSDYTRVSNEIIGIQKELSKETGESAQAFERLKRAQEGAARRATKLEGIGDYVASMSVLGVRGGYADSVSGLSAEAFAGRVARGGTPVIGQMRSRQGRPQGYRDPASGAMIAPGVGTFASRRAFRQAGATAYDRPVSPELPPAMVAAREARKKEIEDRISNLKNINAENDALREQAAIRRSIEKNQRRVAAKAPREQPMREISAFYGQIGEIGMGKIVTDIDMMGKSYKEVSADIRAATAASNGSISSLEKQRSVWIQLRNGLDPASDAFKEVTRDIERVDRALEKTSRTRRKFSPGKAAQVAGATISGGIFGGPEGFLGGAIGGAVGGVGGSFAGAALGAQVGGLRRELGGYAEYAAQIEKLKIALKGLTKDQNEFNYALAASQKVTQDFNIPQQESIRGITRLAAAIKGAGGPLTDAEVVFRNVTTAIKATGGSAQDVEGAVTAMVQVFSKGKVSAEELSGQLGERLPGAVTMFAKANNMSLTELQDNLKAGTVGLNELMKFVRSLGDTYGATARKISDSNADAGARLQVVVNDMKTAIGDALIPIGAQLQDAFGKFLQEITPTLVEVLPKIGELFLGIVKNLDLIAQAAAAVFAVVAVGKITAIIASIGSLSAAIFTLKLNAIVATKALIGLNAAALLNPYVALAAGAAALGVAIFRAAQEQKRLNTLIREGSVADIDKQLAENRSEIIKIEQRQLNPGLFYDVSPGSQGTSLSPRQRDIQNLEKYRDAEKKLQEDRKRAVYDATQGAGLPENLLRPFDYQSPKGDGGDGKGGSSTKEKRQRKSQLESINARLTLLDIDKMIRANAREIVEAQADNNFERVKELSLQKLSLASQKEFASVQLDYRDALARAAGDENEQMLKAEAAASSDRAIQELRFKLKEDMLDLEQQSRLEQEARTRAAEDEVFALREQLGLVSDQERISRYRTNLEEQGTPNADELTDLYRQTVDPTFAEGISQNIRALKQELEELLDPINQVTGAANAIGTAFTDSFTSVINGSATTQEALANFFGNIGKYFLDMAAQIIQKMITMAILNSIVAVLPGGGGGGGGGGDIFADIAARGGLRMKNGGVFGKGGLVPFAMGGIVDKPTMFAYANGGVGRFGLMGEAGPEAILPLKRGSNGKLGVQVSGGSSNNIVVNVDASGTRVQGDDTRGKQLGGAISAAVQAELIKQRRPGGLLAS